MILIPHSDQVLTLYHNARTRSLRILWLLEELGLPYTLKSIEYTPPVDGKIFMQKTPTGRFPTLEDGAVTICESGAIVEYLIERYGDGSLAPPMSSPLRAKYLQWVHFPEGTLNPHLNAIQRFAKVAPEIVAAMRQELDVAIALINQELSKQPYIVGDMFTGADVMLAVSLLSINMLGLISPVHTHIAEYFERLQSRPALVKVMQS